MIYAISVFTRLDSGLQDLQLTEPHRILRPGGVHGANAASELDSAGQNTLLSQRFSSQKIRETPGPSFRLVANHLFSNVRYERVPDGIQNFVLAQNADAPAI